MIIITARKVTTGLQVSPLTRRVTVMMTVLDNDHLTIPEGVMLTLDIDQTLGTKMTYMTGIVTDVTCV